MELCNPSPSFVELITPEQHAMLMQGLEVVARHPIEQIEDPKKLF